MKAETKAYWRREFRTRFKELADKEEKTNQLVEHLLRFLQNRKGDWCVYQALESEISLNSLLPKVSESNPEVTWVYPKVIADRLHFFEPLHGFEKAYAGILEPVPHDAREVSSKEISGFLVPALGFDQRGVRLGKGKGYYDRALAGFAGEIVGVSFSSLIVDELPTDAWDVPMQWLATEKGVRKVNEKKIK